MFAPVLRGRCFLLRVLRALLSAAVPRPPLVTSYDTNPVFANTFSRRGQQKITSSSAANEHQRTLITYVSRVIKYGGGGGVLKANRAQIQWIVQFKKYENKSHTRQLHSQRGNQLKVIEFLEFHSFCRL